MRLIEGRSFYKEPWYGSYHSMMDRCYRKKAYDIPDGMVCGFLNGVVATRSGLAMVTYSLDSNDLHDGAEIKLPREEQKQ